MSATDSERDTLQNVVRALWPQGGGPTRRLRVLPSADHPRLLIPERPRRAAAALSGALRERGTRAARLRTGMLRFGFATGTAGIGPGAWTNVGSGIEAYLEAALGRPVVVAVHLGPPRANRKPVLAVALEDGSLLGFAKLGVDPLSDCLVRNETAALTELADASLSTVQVPRVLHVGSYGGHPILVQSALPVASARPATTEPVVHAQVEVARAFGVRQVPLAGSSYLATIRTRTANLRERGTAVMTLIDRLSAADGASDVAFGCWHGDWRSVNVAVTDAHTLVWDWERFARDVPVGFDVLHQTLADANERRLEPDQIPPLLLNQAAKLLAPFDIDASRAPLIAQLYLLELAVRYLTDDQASAGARLGHVDQWLLPFLERQTEPA
jgi:hypothetical protein